jgi:hypothetical protein
MREVWALALSTAMAAACGVNGTISGTYGLGADRSEPASDGMVPPDAGVRDLGDLGAELDAAGPLDASTSPSDAQEPPDSGAPPDAGVDPGADPHLVRALGLMNAARADAGAPPLMLDLTMCACALRHAQDLANCTMGKFDNFQTCAHQDFRMGDTCGGWAENEGGSTGDIDSAFQESFDQMMAEGPPPPGTDNHYLNIMNPSESAVGIGIYVHPTTGLVFNAQDFR